jgi:hypothetical protein
MTAPDRSPHPSIRPCRAGSSKDDSTERRPKVLLADKGYDSDAIREDSRMHGTNPPPNPIAAPNGRSILPSTRYATRSSASSTN